MGNIQKKKEAEAKQKVVTLTVGALNEKGYGVANVGGHVYWVVGGLPGEELEAVEFKRKKKVRYAKVTKVIKPNRNRRSPKDKDSYLSTSPYQIISAKYENQIKKELINELFINYAETKLPDFEITSNDQEFGYRNKFEFAFYIDDTEKISLAFHKKDTRRGRIPITNIALAPDTVNDFIKIFISDLNKQFSESKFEFRDLKSLVVRYSFAETKLVYALYLKSDVSSIKLESTDELPYVKGSLQIYSNPKSPASVTDHIIHRQGETDLYEEIKGRRYFYGYESFFQINPSLFEETVADISAYLLKLRLDGEKMGLLCDLYSGVGTIGLSLSDYFDTVKCFEINPDSPKYTEMAAKENGIKNISVIAGAVEKNLGSLGEDIDCTVVDPPRSGLHNTLIDKILALKPPHLIYLSCNPKTQAGDYSRLKVIYDIRFNRAYNYYPNTPHVENLLILECKK